MEEVRARQFDVQEVIDLAGEAIQHLYHAKEGLHSARDWGIADVFCGGVIITTLKQQKINDARVEIAYADEALRILQSRIQDQFEVRNISFEMSRLATLADYIFDNPITDLYIQNQINEASNQVDEVIQHTEELIRRVYDL